VVARLESAPLLDLPDGSAPTPGKGSEFAWRSGSPPSRARPRDPAAWLRATIVLWLFIVSIFPWTTLAVTTATAIALGMLAAWRARGRRAPKR
jgi:hypothetical protein